MRDVAAIKSFCCYPQGGDFFAYCFGNTMIVAEEWEDVHGAVYLRPSWGDYCSHGEWHDLDEADVAAYCELLAEEINGRKPV